MNLNPFFWLGVKATGTAANALAPHVHLDPPPRPTRRVPWAKVPIDREFSCGTDTVWTKRDRDHGSPNTGTCAGLLFGFYVAAAPMDLYLDQPTGKGKGAPRG